MVRIRRFGIIRTATMAAALYAFIILASTLLIFLPFALLAAAGRDATGSLGFGAVGVVGVVIFGLVGAVAYAAIGWVMTAIACVIYNVVAGFVGGIEVQLESAAPPSTPAWGGPYAAGQPYAMPPGYGPTPGYGAPPSRGAPGTTPPPPSGRPA